MPRSPNHRGRCGAGRPEIRLGRQSESVGWSAAHKWHGMGRPEGDRFMQLYDALMTTRAMRRYTDEPVTDDEIVHCLQAAQQAPSGGNVQPWQYLVVTDPSAAGRARRALPNGVRPLRAHARRDPAALPHARGRGVVEPHVRRVAPPRRPPRRGARTRVVPAPDHRLDAERRRRARWTSGRSTRRSIPPCRTSCWRLATSGSARRSRRSSGSTTTIFGDLLGLPEAMEVAALVPMGRPSGRFGIARRKPAAAVTHWEQVRHEAL